MKTWVVAVIAVLGVGIGVAVGMSLFGGSAKANGSGGPGADSERRALEAEIARLREEARAEPKEPAAPAKEEDPAPSELETGSGTVAGTTPAVKDASPTEPAAEEEKDAGPRFFAEAYSGVFKKVDWKTVGHNLKELRPVVDRIVADLLAGKPPAPKDQSKAQQLNIGLMKAALTIADDLPGEETNAKFIDPGFMLNAISETLAAAELPLDEEQGKALRGIARDFMSRDEARRASYADGSWKLERMTDEAALKDEFFATAFDRLTPEQRAIVQPEGYATRLQLSVFSSSVMYPGRTGVGVFKNDEELKAMYESLAARRLGVRDEEKESARPVVADWVATLPSELTRREVIGLDRMGLVQADRVTAWGRQIVRLGKALATELAYDEERLGNVREFFGILVALESTGAGD